MTGVIQGLPRFHGLRRTGTGSALSFVPLTRAPSRRCKIRFMLRTADLLGLLNRPLTTGSYPGISPRISVLL